MTGLAVAAFVLSLISLGGLIGLVGFLYWAMFGKGSER